MAGDSQNSQKKESFPDLVIKDFGSIENGIEYFEKNLNKEPIDYRLNLQVLTNLIGEEERAFEYSDQLMAIAPDDPRIIFNRGWHILRRGDFKRGFEFIEAGRQIAAYGSPQPASMMPILHDSERSRITPESIADHHHIVLSLEGGFGDEIINARFVRNIWKKFNKKTIVACRPELISLFAKMPHVASVVAHQALPGVYHDLWVPGMSGPLHLCDSEAELYGEEPYLAVDHLPNLEAWRDLVAKNRRAGKKLKVGIRWSGSSQFEHQQFRRFPKEIILDLQSIAGIQFYSFQKDDDLVDLSEEIVDLSPFLKDWSDTACAMSEMDLMISSCTSTAHCAGALGTKTWVITPVLPYYIWAHSGDKSHWYKDVYLYRQKKFGQWDEPAAQLRSDLIEFATTGAVNWQNLNGRASSVRSSA